MVGIAQVVLITSQADRWLPPAQEKGREVSMLQTLLSVHHMSSFYVALRRHGGGRYKTKNKQTV